MIYTIGILEDVQGNIKVYFDKSGNEYVVAIYNTDSHISTHKDFKNLKSAIKAFQEVSSWILEGDYSEDDRRKMLLDMVD